MALNIVFQGKIFDSSGIPFIGSEVRYQAYFYKATSGSSSSSWNNSKLSELGDFSVNLGDNDWLTQYGKVGIGDKVILCFWTPGTSNRDDHDLLEWSMIEITLDESTLTHVQNIQIKSAFNPTCLFSITGSTDVNEDVIISDEGTNDEHNWIYASMTHYHTAERFSKTIFEMNKMDDGLIDIDWGDGTASIDIGLNPGVTYPHQYTLPDDYDIEVTVNTHGGKFCITDYSRRVYWHTPVIDFDIDNEDPLPIVATGLGQTVNITNTTTDTDSRSITDGWHWDWELNDTQGLVLDGTSGYEVSYGSFDEIHIGVDHTFGIIHQWHNPGIHFIILRLHWYDGFDWHPVEVEKEIRQHKWVVINGLTWTTPIHIQLSCEFTPSIGGDSGKVPSIDYQLDHADYIKNNLGPYDSFEYTFLISNTHTITQRIRYHDGFADQLMSEDFDVIMSPIASYMADVGIDNQPNKFTSTSIAGLPPITNFLWQVIDGVNVIATGPNEPSFFYHWPYAGTFTVKLTVTDNNSATDSYSQVYDGVPYRTGMGGVKYVDREVPEKKKKVKVKLSAFSEVTNEDVERNRKETEKDVKVKLSHKGWGKV